MMEDHPTGRDRKLKSKTKTHHHHHHDDPATLSSSSSSCDPGANKTLLTIGQDFFSIEEYILSQYNASLHRRHSKNTLQSFHPAASMVYTDIQTLRGVDAPIDYGSGIEYAQGLAEAFPDAGIQIGLWLNGTTGCRDIVEGSLENNIRKLFANIASWNLPKVFLRVGYEFDNPYFGYSEDPSYYKQAFRIMVEACERQLGVRECHTRVAFCWHSWASPRWISPLDDFYPGDDVVDWVGISIFQQLYPWAEYYDDTSSGGGGDFAGGSMIYVKEVLDYAKRHDKPVMIAESTPFGGMFWNGQDFGNKKDSIPLPLLLHNNTTSEAAATTTTPDKNNIWNLWFAPVLQLIEQYDIRMWSYINCDWNAQPMWHNIGFGDTRLASSQRVMENWWEEVLQNPRFVSAPLNCYGTDHDSSPVNDDEHDAASLLSLTLAPPAIVGSWSFLGNNQTMEILLPKLFVLTLVLGMALLLGVRYYSKSRRHRPKRRTTRILELHHETTEEVFGTKQEGYGSTVET